MASHICCSSRAASAGVFFNSGGEAFFRAAGIGFLPLRAMEAEGRWTVTFPRRFEIQAKRIDPGIS
jgi:hypothetical protein